MTVRWLRTQGYRNVWGIDREIGSFLPIQKENSEGLVLGDAYALPFDDSSMDVLLYECSLSIMDNPNQALREACRVLRTGGVLLISDLFASHAAYYCDGFLRRIETLSVWETRLDETGFCICSIF